MQGAFMIKGFREFLLRGNVIDLAVAFVIGVAFTAVVTAFTQGLVQPVVNLFLGGGVDGGKVTVDDQVFDFGAVINAVITFLIMAAVVYFVFVHPMNRIKEQQATHLREPKVAEESDLDVLKDIRAELQAQRAGGGSTHSSGSAV
jgi:large conductance mechanosensitive channel